MSDVHFRNEALEDAAEGITDLELAIEDMKVLQYYSDH